MEAWQAVVLGVVQGLTEFLPISSSGHLVLGQRLLGFSEPMLLFDVAVHVGTLLAVFMVFWRDLWAMATGIFRRGPAGADGRRLLYLVIVASVPTAAIGLLFQDDFETLFGSVRAVSLALMFTGALLMSTITAPARGRRLNQVGWPTALVVGVMQGLAITPGISRSGSTIATALLLGVDRELAARYSFVMSVPAILGALLLQLRKVPAVQPGDWVAMGVGGLAAAIAGLVALMFLLSLVRRGKLHYFAFYCWAVGLAALLFL